MPATFAPTQVIPSHLLPRNPSDTPAPRSTDSTVTLPVREGVEWSALPPADWRYDSLVPVGQGGMAGVYSARDRLLDRRVALKVLLDNDGLGRFREEARIHAHLQHPAIPALHDAGRFSDGRYFLALRFVQGRALTEVVNGPADDPAELDRRLGWFEQVCMAVAYAHRKGVLHRDLKPENVLLSGYGRVSVIDWGLAEARGAGGLSPSAERCHADRVLGTLAYMAPEAAAGEPADERTDMFGLGGILCHLLTGRPVFCGGWDEVARQARCCDTREARRRMDASDAPRRLVVLAKRCLAEPASVRPSSAREVAEVVLLYRRSGL
jgi:eukaryotic-like serine/threonine-protein kinase